MIFQGGASDPPFPSESTHVNKSIENYPACKEFSRDLTLPPTPDLGRVNNVSSLRSSADLNPLLHINAF